MAEDFYSAQVREHLAHPRNAGPMQDPDAVGVQANPICGDTLKLMLRIAGDRVTEVRWQTVGCEPAKAASSIASELATGLSLEEVEALTSESIGDAAGGFPSGKEHAASLASGALRRAIATYRAGRPRT
jgi:nitrogen fixation protein NifU and related proteins